MITITDHVSEDGHIACESIRLLTVPVLCGAEETKISPDPEAAAAEGTLCCMLGIPAKIGRQVGRNECSSIQ